MSKLNIYGLREYSRGDIFECTTDEVRVAERFYIMNEADEAIEKITEGAISMFRESNKCRGLDLKSPLGRIADIAFKHWCFVESTQTSNIRLQEDKTRLLRNNRDLRDDVASLKRACNDKDDWCLHTLKELRHQKYKRCLAMAEMCNARYNEEDAKVNGCGASWEYTSKEMKYLERWRWRWDALADKFKEKR